MSFECGDEVIDLRYGKGIVRSVDRKDNYPIFVEFEKNDRVSEYTEEGREQTTDLYPVLFHLKGFTPPSCSEPERKFKYNFKPFDKVLANHGKGCIWHLALFAYYDLDYEHFPYVTLHGEHWMHCIPFEGNEEKLGSEYQDN